MIPRPSLVRGAAAVATGLALGLAPAPLADAARPAGPTAVAVTDVPVADAQHGLSVGALEKHSFVVVAADVPADATVRVAALDKNGRTHVLTVPAGEIRLLKVTHWVAVKAQAVVGERVVAEARLVSPFTQLHRGADVDGLPGR